MPPKANEEKKKDLTPAQIEARKVRNQRRQERKTAIQNGTLQPHAPAPSLGPIRQAVEHSRGLNPEASPATMATLNNITRRLDALSHDRTFNAANFGMKAASYDEELSSYLREHGVTIPCDTVETCTRTMAQVLARTATHPKRVGARGESLVINTTANKIFTIPPSGSGGWLAGNIIVAFTPNHVAYKGIVVLAVNPATGAWRVLCYIGPTRDPELISTQCLVLFTLFGISAPSGIAGTSVVTTAQLIRESAKVSVGPASLIPGRVAAVAEGRFCPPKVIGPERAEIANFTATEPLSLVKRYSSFNPQNNSIINVANPGNIPANSFGCSAYPKPTGSYCINATGSNASSALAAGYQSAIAAQFISGGGYNVAAGTTATLWKLSNNTDYLRHPMLGDFELRATFPVSNGGNFFNFFYDFVFDDGDGTDTTITKSLSDNAVGTEVDLVINTRGGSILAPYRGLMLRDIVIRAQAAGAGALVIISDTNPAGTSVPDVLIEFFEVPAETNYLVHVISGAQSGMQLALDLSVDVEAIIDPAATNDTFLSGTSDLPYQQDILPALLRAHLLTTHAGTKANPFEASSFGDTFRKILKKGGQIGGSVAKFVPGPAGQLLGNASKLATRAADVRNFQQGLSLASDAANLLNGTRAASFAPAAEPPFNPAGEDDEDGMPLLVRNLDHLHGRGAAHLRRQAEALQQPQAFLPLQHRLAIGQPEPVADPEDAVWARASSFEPGELIWCPARESLQRPTAPLLHHFERASDANVECGISPNIIEREPRSSCRAGSFSPGEVVFYYDPTTKRYRQCVVVEQVDEEKEFWSEHIGHQVRNVTYEISCAFPLFHLQDEDGKSIYTREYMLRHYPAHPKVLPRGTVTRFKRGDGNNAIGIVTAVRYKHILASGLDRKGTSPGGLVFDVNTRNPLDSTIDDYPVPVGATHYTYFIDLNSKFSGNCFPLNDCLVPALVLKCIPIYTITTSDSHCAVEAHNITSDPSELADLRARVPHHLLTIATERCPASQLSEVFASCGFDNVRATGFGGKGNISKQDKSLFFFPAVNDINKTTHLWVRAPIVNDSPVVDPVSSELGTRLGYVSKDITGRSGTLALLLANLYAYGFPVRAGTYSGEIVDVSPVFQDQGNSPRPVISEISFTILPVADTDEKIRDMASIHANLTALCPMGFYADGTMQTFDPTYLFGEGVTCKFTKITAPSGYPDNCFRVRAVLRK